MICRLKLYPEDGLSLPESLKGKYISCAKMFFIAPVFTFILKLRFPVNRSVRDVIQRRYGATELRCFRGLDLRCCELAADIQFLETCESNDLTSKFFKFKLAARNLRYQRKLLKKEISQNYIQKYNTDSTRNNLLDELRRMATI